MTKGAVAMLEEAGDCLKLTIAYVANHTLTHCSQCGRRIRTNESVDLSRQMVVVARAKATCYLLTHASCQREPEDTLVDGDRYEPIGSYVLIRILWDETTISVVLRPTSPSVR